jgi:hypothetical protein
MNAEKNDNAQDENKHKFSPLVTWRVAPCYDDFVKNFRGCVSDTNSHAECDA